MDFSTLWPLLAGILPVHVAQVIAWVLMALGALCVVGLAIVKISPTQDDDAFVDKMLAVPVLGSFLQFLIAFSPIQRK